MSERSREEKIENLSHQSEFFILRLLRWRRDALARMQEDEMPAALTEPQKEMIANAEEALRLHRERRGF